MANDNGVNSSVKWNVNEMSVWWYKDEMHLGYIIQRQKKSGENLCGNAASGVVCLMVGRVSMWC